MNLHSVLIMETERFFFECRPKVFYYWRRAIIGDCAYTRDNTVFTLKVSRHVEDTTSKVNACVRDLLFKDSFTHRPCNVLKGLQDFVL